jgi:hypothetical protein
LGTGRKRRCGFSCVVFFPGVMGGRGGGLHWEVAVDRGVGEEEAGLHWGVVEREGEIRTERRNKNGKEK